MSHYDLILFLQGEYGAPGGRGEPGNKGKPVGDLFMIQRNIKVFSL